MQRPLIVLSAVVLGTVTAIGPAIGAAAETQMPTSTPSASPTMTWPMHPGPAPTPVSKPYVPNTAAHWVNDTLQVVTSYAGPIYEGSSDGYTEVRVDGKVVETITDSSIDDRLITLPRAITEAPALVEVVVIDQEERGSYYENYPTTVFSATVRRVAVRAALGQVPTEDLLDKLPVGRKTNAGSYKAAKFGHWIDANRDGENTRAEVLEAESSKRVTKTKSGIIKTGRWTSPYDANTTTSATDVRIDHLVPLREAWTSGAASWSARKRLAYANDLGYAPSLFAVPIHVNLYQTRNAADTCSYIRNYVGVKYRWGLRVSPTEKSELRSDLARYCIDPFVTKPAKPNIDRLTGPKHAAGSSR